MCAGEVRSDRPLKKTWAPSAEAFRRFLAWLDEGADSDGERYLEMRRRLVAYFDRKRCSSPHDLADETLTRVARRLEEEGAITDAVPAQYCYIVARYVFLEHLRSVGRRAEFDGPALASPADPLAVDERPFACLDRCLDALASEDRSLILAYYASNEGNRIEARRTLARQRGLTSNALSIRACRVRARLEACVRECLDRT